MVAAIPIIIAAAAGAGGAAVVANNLPKPQAPQLPSMPVAPNTTAAASDAASNQRQPQGAQGTIFGGRTTGGVGGVLSSGGAVSQRMLLGS